MSTIIFILFGCLSLLERFKQALIHIRRHLFGFSRKGRLRSLQYGRNFMNRQRLPLAGHLDRTAADLFKNFQRKSKFLEREGMVMKLSEPLTALFANLPSNKNLIKVLILCLVFSLAMIPLGQAYAASFTVNSTADQPDVSPGDGICRTASNTCTLRAAIMEANSSA